MLFPSLFLVLTGKIVIVMTMSVLKNKQIFILIKH